MSNPKPVPASAIAEARRLVRDAEENLAARRRLLNGLLPELPATWTYEPAEDSDEADEDAVALAELEELMV